MAINLNPTPSEMTKYAANTIHFRNKYCYYKILKMDNDRPSNSLVKILATYDEPSELVLKNRAAWELFNAQEGILGEIEGQDLHKTMIGGIVID